MKNLKTNPRIKTAKFLYYWQKLPFAPSGAWGTQDSMSEKVAFCKKDFFRSSEYRGISNKTPQTLTPPKLPTKLAPVPWGLGPMAPSRGMGTAVPESKGGLQTYILNEKMNP